MKFGTFAVQWFEHNDESWAPATQDLYCILLSNHVIPALGQLRLKEVTAWAVESMLKNLKKDLCPARANICARLVRIILDASIGEGHLKENLAAKAKLLKEPKAEKHSWTMEEMKKVAYHLEPHWYPYFITLMFTGARPGELAALRWSDVDMEAGTIRIKRSRNRFGEKTTKTSAGVRTIPMHDEVKTVLVEQLEKTGDDKHVFLNTQGEPINQSVSCKWKTACEKAGVDPRRSYEIRHSFASALVGRGRISEASRIIGHSDISTTIRNYATNKGVKLDQMEEAMNEVFAS